MGPGASGKQQGEACDSASDLQVQHRISAAVATGEMRGFIAIARIVRPQGRKGEVLAEILTDFPSRFKDLRRAFLDDGSYKPRAVTVQDAWLHKGKVVLKFAGVESISDAETLRGQHVLIPEEEKIALPANQYYLWELVGCLVVTESGGVRKALGNVTEVERTGGVDLLHVLQNSQEILIPFTQAICKVIDPEAKVIVVDPPEDLLDLNREQGV